MDKRSRVILVIRSAITEGQWGLQTAMRNKVRFEVFYN